ncbi:hypothetical protein ANCCEY_00974 [Ancylostoma ceylanicum]|uniref:Uncharacterized protein n=1 Tax=Ancylostoma ceylanicum TaxID=53326 RepID=A0A0D6M8V2_9BILA|nr:hypothetical protein ANCCEY_00974 [Ancylostoma ceylanicum]
MEGIDRYLVRQKMLERAQGQGVSQILSLVSLGTARFRLPRPPGGRTPRLPGYGKRPRPPGPIPRPYPRL